MKLGDIVLVKGYEGSPTPYIVAIVTGSRPPGIVGSLAWCSATMFPRGEQPQCASLPVFASELEVDDYLKEPTLGYRMAAFPRPSETRRPLTAPA